MNQCCIGLVVASGMELAVTYVRNTGESMSSSGSVNELSAIQKTVHLRWKRDSCAEDTCSSYSCLQFLRPPWVSLHTGSSATTHHVAAAVSAWSLVEDILSGQTIPEKNDTGCGRTSGQNHAESRHASKK